jgi:hypothetical protein
MKQVHRDIICGIIVASLVAFGVAGYTTIFTPAHSQVNVVPQIGLSTANLRQNTYTASILKLVPAAATTDFFCISGSTTKSIKINRIELSGTGTLGSFPIYLNHNTTLDTGTRAVAATYGPVAYPLSSANPTATAVPIAYNTTGGNPTIGGTATTLRSGVLLIGASATYTAPIDRLVWNFGTESEEYNQRLFIPANTTEQICLNLVAASPTAVLEGYFEWTEE